MNEEELIHRLKNAVVMLRVGQKFNVGDLTFDCKGPEHFCVIGWTVCSDIMNLTEGSALAELNEIKDLFNKMIAASHELADFIKYRQVEYTLGYDYGMGGLEICKEIGGQIKWIAELKEQRQQP